MTQYAGTQQEVVYPYIGMPGDQYGLPQDWLPTQGYIAATDVGIATGVFGVPATNTVQQGQTTAANIFAGFVLRDQASVIPYSNTEVGYSFLVAAKQQVQVIRKGNLIMKISQSFNVGSVINVGDQVYVSKIDGTLAVGVTDTTNWYQTDFVVTNTDQDNTSVANQVVISNTNQFLGQ